nr:leucine-rich repeat domain-containing protein [Prevotella sp.]
MQYPTISEYVKAIQDAGNNLDKLAHLTPVVDNHGEPYHICDAFAVVFKMQDKSTGKYYTLKCFLKDQKECADDAYQIDDEQNMVRASYSTSVKYLEKELLVHSQDKVGKFLVLLSDWVDEKSMETFLSMNEDMTTEITDEELNEAIIDEYGVKYSKDGRKLLKSPRELDGTYSIKRGTKIICDEAFGRRISLNHSFLNGLVIPDSVIRIGKGAFANCSFLRSLVIPDSVTSIGDYAFRDCSSLSSIVIPDGVTSIGKSTFYFCSSLRSLVLPDSVTSIGDFAFFGCSSLRSLVIPDNVTSIGDYAFSGCSSLSSLVLPDNVTNIGDCAFSGCSSLSSLVIPDSVTSIGDLAFSGCSSLSNIVIPDSVTSIGAWAFSGCSSLSSLVIPDGVTSIGDGAFKDCNFPDNLKHELISRFGDKIFRN